MAGELVLAQPQAPCLLCGCTPVSEDEKNEVLPMVIGVGMDVNWGETVQICATCCGVISDLWDRVPEEKYKKVKGRLDKLQEKHNELQEEHDRLKSRVSKMLDGAKARKEAREDLKEAVNG